MRSGSWAACTNWLLRPKSAQLILEIIRIWFVVTERVLRWMHVTGT